VATTSSRRRAVRKLRVKHKVWFDGHRWEVAAVQAATSPVLGEMIEITLARGVGDGRQTLTIRRKPGAKFQVE
jgi:hypothetical protein